jgi:hypothetical protein
MATFWLTKSLVCIDAFIRDSTIQSGVRRFCTAYKLEDFGSLSAVRTTRHLVRTPICPLFHPSGRRVDGNQGAGHADHTHGNGAEVAQDPLSLPSGPITRLRAKRFKEELNGLIQENWADSKKTKMGSNKNQGLVHVIKAIEEDN